MPLSTLGRARGFTLIEIVSVLVILGSMVAMAMPIYQSLRWEARKATLDAIRAAMRANMNAARAAWLTQGFGPGSTVQVNGQAIEVEGEGVTYFGTPIPAGVPTGLGMYRMLGCGTDTPTLNQTITCVSFPGYYGLVWSHGVYFWPFSSGTAATTWCIAHYSGVYAGLVPTIWDGYDWDGMGTSGQYMKPTDPDPGRAAGAC